MPRRPSLRIVWLLSLALACGHSTSGLDGAPRSNELGGAGGQSSGAGRETSSSGTSSGTESPADSGMGARQGSGGATDEPSPASGRGGGGATPATVGGSDGRGAGGANQAGAVGVEATGAGGTAAGGAGSGGGTSASGGRTDATGGGASGGTTAIGGTSGASGSTGGLVFVPGCLTSAVLLDNITYEPSLEIGSVGIPDIIFHTRAADSSGNLELLVGSPGQAQIGTLMPGGENDDWSLSAPLKIISTPTYFNPDNGITLTSLEVCLEDNGITGFASFDVVNDSDGHDNRQTVSELVAGARDFSPPALIDPGLIDPLAPKPMLVSKPLFATGLAMLIPATGPTYALTPEQMHGVTVAFVPAQILPLGFEAPPWVQSGPQPGLGVLTNFQLRTPADPGVQAQDGFESDLRVVSLDDQTATLVEGATAIDGAKSVRVEAGATALFHLERPAGAHAVRFAVKPSITALDFAAAIDVRVGVVGGTAVTSAALWLDPATELAPGAPVGGTVRDVELALDEDGADVLFSITPPSLAGSTSAIVAVVLDDLRIE